MSEQGSISGLVKTASDLDGVLHLVALVEDVDRWEVFVDGERRDPEHSRFVSPYDPRLQGQPCWVIDGASVVEVEANGQRGSVPLVEEPPARQKPAASTDIEWAVPTIRTLADDWRRSELRPKLDRDAAQRWDELIRWWVHESSLPVPSRSGATGRRGSIAEVDGRQVVFVDKLTCPVGVRPCGLGRMAAGRVRPRTSSLRRDASGVRVPRGGTRDRHLHLAARVTTEHAVSKLAAPPHRASGSPHEHLNLDARRRRAEGVPTARTVQHVRPPTGARGARGDPDVHRRDAITEAMTAGGTAGPVGRPTPTPRTPSAPTPAASPSGRCPSAAASRARLRAGGAARAR